MTPFERDIDAQPQVVERVVAHYSAGGLDALHAVRALASDSSQVVFVAMGSSRSAALAAALTTGSRWPTVVPEAGELLHYGLPAVRPDALVVVVSQSGRSVETVAVAERLRSAGHERLVAVTNDPSSPMADAAAVVLPIPAGDEATVATKTWMATFVVLRLLAETLTQEPPARHTASPSLLLALNEVTRTGAVADGAAAAFAACPSLVVVARGPALAAADYGALILKETAAIVAECLAGGSFRHGPLEVTGPTIGVVVLAPSGRTHDLCVRLALDTASLGSPTWLIGDDATSLPTATDRLRVTTLPAVDEAYAPLTMSVPIQRLAASLARGRGREPGVLLRSQKVTDRE